MSAVPPALRRLAARGFVNPCALLEPPRLHAAESLCGDRSARLLLLSQDAGPASLYRARLEAGDPDPWRVDPRWPSVRTVAARLREGGVALDAPGRCGVFWGCVCWLLRDDGRATGPLPPGWREAARAALPETLARAPAATDIACLGRESFDLVAAALGVSAAWREARDARRAVAAGRFRLHALSHPGNLGTLARLADAPWREKERAAAEDWRAMLAAALGARAA